MGENCGTNISILSEVLPERSLVAAVAGQSPDEQFVGVVARSRSVVEGRVSSGTPSLTLWGRKGHTKH